jgi:hypothetical protein
MASLFPPGILILATDEHGETRINTEEFNKLTIKQKNKYSFVKIRDNPCKSVAKKIQNEKSKSKVSRKLQVIRWVHRVDKKNAVVLIP